MSARHFVSPRWFGPEHRQRSRVMKAGPQAPAPGSGLCAWRPSQRRALQDTEPNQKLGNGSFPKKMRVTTKTGAPSAVKYLSMFSSAEVCGQRK